MGPRTLRFESRSCGNRTLSVDLAPVAHPTAVLDSQRIMVRPVHQSAEIIPFVHATEMDPVTERQWYPVGKIDVAIAPSDSNRVYALIQTADQGSVWRSDDGGENWEKKNDYVSSATGPHYYQEIFASPHDVNTVYQVAPTLHKTVDGGKTMEPVRNRSVHGDYHSVVFDPSDPDYLMVGTDGGVYESFDGTSNWKFFANMPITQFYKVAVDYDEPFYNVYGGTQDNSTQGGPSRTMNVNGIRNSDWFITVFADGHQPAVDPTNPDIDLVAGRLLVERLPQSSAVGEVRGQVAVGDERRVAAGRVRFAVNVRVGFSEPDAVLAVVVDVVSPPGGQGHTIVRIAHAIGVLFVTHVVGGDAGQRTHLDHFEVTFGGTQV